MTIPATPHTRATTEGVLPAIFPEQMFASLYKVDVAGVSTQLSPEFITGIEDIAQRHFARLRAEHAEAMKIVQRVAEMYETEQELGSFPEGKTWLYIPHVLGQQAQALASKVGVE